MDTLFAFRIWLEGSPGRSFVAVAADLVSAVATASAALQTRGEGRAITSIELLAPVVGMPRGLADAPSPLSPSTLSKPSPLPRSKRLKGPRAEGGRSPRRTRVQQLVDLLVARGGEAHVSEIEVSLGVSNEHAQNVMRMACRAGLAERVGSRTGRVRLVGAAGVERSLDPSSADRVEPTAPMTAVPQPPTSGLGLRVWSALVELGGSRTASEVAGVLGCRPREAGNSLALLVAEGLVVQDRGHSPPRYEPALS